MTGAGLPDFEVTPELTADCTPEDRGVGRDGVRLLVSDGAGDEDRPFRELPEVLRPGDLLVVNESATLPASLPALVEGREFRLNLSTEYGPGLWLAESRRTMADPGPIPFAEAASLLVAGVGARQVAGFPGIPRLSFYRFDSPPGPAMAREGQPIRYGYLARDYPLGAYQTIFARVPGSAEMASAGRPFTERVRTALSARGVEFATLVLHAGVSSLETEPDGRGGPPVYPEPYCVPPETAAAVARARARGGRVIAVGTTVVRALESAADGGVVRPSRGFTRLFLSEGRPGHVVDGLVTGFHTSRSTHLALLAGLFGAPMIQRSYRAALDGGYLWHEFGDSHLLLRRGG